MWNRQKAIEDQINGILSEVQPLPGSKKDSPSTVGVHALGSRSIAIGGDLHIHLGRGVEPKIDDDQAGTIRSLVEQLVSATSQSHARIYSEIHSRYRITQLRDLPAADFGLASSELIDRIASARGHN